MNKYEKYISDLLFKTDYVLGKDLNDLVKQKFNLENSYERKIVQRAAEIGIIHSTSPVTFGNGQFAYMHPEKSLNKEMILKITKENRPALYRIISMMDYYGGILPTYEAMKLSAAPLDKKKNKSDSIEKLIEELKILKLGQQIKSSKYGMKFIVRPAMADDCAHLIDLHNSRMRLDSMFIPDILKSLRSYNIIDNDRLLYRRKTSPAVGISHNNFVWDAIAYTRTTGINEIRSSEADSFEKQTLVVLDIVVSRPYTDEDLQGFLARIRSMTNAVKTGKRKVLPIIIYGETESKILINRIHKLGFLSFDLGSIYGSKVYQIIKNLFSIKQKDFNSGEEMQNLIEKTLVTMRDAGQEDNLNSIKGDLFESLMFPVIKLLFPDADIEQGKKFSKITDGIEEKHEYDHIVNSARLQENVVFELKGYSSSSYISLGDPDKHSTLRYFFRKTLPFATEQLQAKEPNYKITGCFITTSNFQEDGITFLNKMNTGKLKPTGIDCWYDGEKLIALLDNLKLQKVKNIVTRYYIKKETEDDQSQENTPIKRTLEQDLPF